MQAEVSEAMRERLREEYEASLDGGTGEPRGMRVEVVEACALGMEAAGARCFPRGGEEYISTSVSECSPSNQRWRIADKPTLVVLVQVKTLPAHQRRGAGKLLTDWGVDLANREGLKICLESTGVGRRLYETCGFEAREEVVHDVSRFGGPERYVWTMMVKEPGGKNG